MKLKPCLFTSWKIVLGAISLLSLSSSAMAAPEAEANPFERSTFGNDWGILSNDIFFGGANAIFGLSPASRTLILFSASESKTSSESGAIVSEAESNEDLFSFSSSLALPFGIASGGRFQPPTPQAPGPADDLYWDANGALPGTGGNGLTATWNTSGANPVWNPDQTGVAPAISWLENSDAIFAGVPGTVTVSGTVNPDTVFVQTTGYTFATDDFQDAINGSIELSSGVNLFIHNPLTNSNVTLEVGGSITGDTGSGITIRGNPFLSTHSRILLTAPNSSIDVPITILRGGTGPGPIGVVSGAPGQAITGSITNNTSGPTLLGANSGAHLTVTGVITGTAGLRVSNTAGSQSGLDGGGGVVVLTGNNTFSGETVIATAAAGQLVLATPGGQALGGTTNVLINSGTLRLDQPNQINNSAGITLAGGTLNLNGQTEGSPGVNGVGMLTLTSNSTIDFGLGSTTSLIQFGGVTSVHTAGIGPDLAIINWAGTPFTGGGPERLLFQGNSGTFTGQFDQGDVSFNGMVGYAVIDFGDFYEVTAVPEPATWLSGALLLGALAVTQRRRLRRWGAIR